MMMNRAQGGVVSALMICLLLLVMALPVAVKAAEATECADLNRQLKGMSAEQRQMLREERFVYGVRVEGLPWVVISSAVIPDCKNRLVAEKYFQNKINGTAEFVYTQEAFERARSSVAHAACEALKTSMPWPDGVSHEIENVVSDDLQPHWTECIVESVRLRKTIDFRLFTKAIFLNPPPQVMKAVNRLIARKSTDLLDVGAAYVLKKNTGEALDLEQVTARLKSARPLNQDVNYSREEQIQTWLKFLRRDDQVALNEVTDFVYFDLFR